MTNAQSDSSSRQRERTYVAFHGVKRVASGSLEHVAAKAKQLLNRDKTASVLVFDRQTAHQVEIDYRGTIKEVAERAKQRVLSISKQNCDEHTDSRESTNRGRGRPKLGVIAREVTLLPRHWAWLKSQPGGASITLRKLVENARKESDGKSQCRAAQNVTYRFMHAIGGDLPGFEEASRGLFGNNEEYFKASLAQWPSAVRQQCLDYAHDAFQK